MTTLCEEIVFSLGWFCYTCAMIKGIFFDIHKVITHGDFSKIYQLFSERVGISADIVSAYHEEHLNDLLTGAVTSEHMLCAFGINNKFRVEDMLNVWSEETVRLSSVDAQVLSLLKQLKKNYVLAALTNLTEQRYGADIEMGLYEYFDYEILSFKEGLKKPDPLYFDRALTITGLIPEEVVFIDDQVKNTDAAKKLEIKSILFTDYDNLITELRLLKVDC